MRPLDLIHVPLQGVRLIEASAGTGKTYTITSLYVRLLLEVPLQVREILVVTFTEAATDELKTRIRKKLREALKCFSSGSCGDPFLEDLAQRCPDRLEALQRLQSALRRFDEASIHTIHGFCQRVLGELPFEAGCLFEHELVPDQSGIVLEAAGDFIRLHFGESMLPELAVHAARKGYTLRFFLGLFHHFRPDIRVIPQAERPEPRGIVDSFRESFAGLARRWEEARGEMTGILQGFEGFKQNIYSPSILRRMIDAMDSYASSPERAVDLFKDFDRFTPWKLRSGTKKAFDPPAHDFFELCGAHQELHGRLSELLDRHLVWLKVEFFRHMKDALPARKDALGVISFDDLLLKVRNSLGSERGAELRQGLGERYRAALIDEFQDTDPVQYEIFSSVFPHGPLFLIGDPKQAIYSFRGADIFTYLRAAGEVSPEARHTLGKNFRSEPGLVQAVNHLFDTQQPFVFEEIAFLPVEPVEDAARQVLHEPGRAPFAVWCISDAPSGRLTKADAEARIYRAVAFEISRLIEAGCSGGILLGDRPVAPRDMAVIVRENRQGRLMRDALASCGIPCVVSSQEDLFETDEAGEMEFLLRAVAQPHSESFVRAALAGSILGLDAHELDLLDRDDSLLERWVDRIRRYHDFWQNGGFTRMFRRLMDEENVRERVLGLPGGERALTNLLHLAEVLGRVCMEERLGMRGLVKWLNRRRDQSIPQAREHQLRLESDDDAVQILTVHKSKGLEFPIVFCPFLWGSSEGRIGKDFVFHDPGQGLEAFLDLGSSGWAEHRDLARRELLAEDMRLVYVALTRAKNRCYLVWGPFGKDGSSALSRLLGSGGGGPDLSRDAPSDGDPLRKELLRRCSGREGCIEVCDLPEGVPTFHRRTAWSQAEFSPREFSGRIDRSWRVSSFSSMIPDSSHDTGAADRDAGSFDLPLETGTGEGVFRLPGGARTGIMLHDLFEKLDFQADEKTVKELAAQCLKLHGFSPSWEETLTGMVRKVLALSIDGAPLSSVPMEHTLREMEFYLPVRNLSRHALEKAFRDGSSRAVPDAFPRMMEDLRFDEATGFLRGFIDLIFTLRGKYYLLDWKSNYLGTGIEHYGREALEKAMVRNYYILQYHLYAAGLDAYLGRRLAGYSFDRHFGGIIYVFLRGLDQAQGRDYGVYRTLPDRGVLRALAESFHNRGGSLLERR